MKRQILLIFAFGLSLIGLILLDHFQGQNYLFQKHIEFTVSDYDSSSSGGHDLRSIQNKDDAPYKDTTIKFKFMVYDLPINGGGGKMTPTAMAGCPFSGQIQAIKAWD
jgi:hypothetical protein